MDQKTWDNLSREQRKAQRDNSDLHLALIGLEGKKIRVTPKRPYGMTTFRVGITTGWKPCHLAMRGNARGSSDMIDKAEHFATITILKG